MPSLMAVVGIDAAKFNEFFIKAPQLARAAGQRIGSAFSSHLSHYLGAAAVLEFTHVITEMGQTIEDTAKRLNISTDSVQTLSFAAKQAGTDLEALTTAFTRMQKNAIAALNDPTGGIAQSFNRLGVSISDLRSKSPDELFALMSGRLAHMNVNALVTADVLATLGKSGGALIPVMKELADKMKEFREGGLLISESDIERLHRAGNAMDKFWLKTKVVGAATVNWFKNMVDTAWGSPTEAFGAGFKHTRQWEESVEGLKKLQARYDARHKKNIDLPPKLDTHVEMEKIDRLRLEVAEKIFQNHLKSLSPAEKMLELKKRIADEEQAALTTESLLDEQRHRLKAETYRSELLAIENKKTSRANHPDANSLQRIGGMAFGGPELLNIHKSMDHSLKSIDRKLGPQLGSVRH